MILRKLLWPIIVLSLLVSCGGGGSSEKKGKLTAEKLIAAAEKAKENAEEAQAEAEDAGAPKYAKATWERAINYYEKGIEYLEENPRKAKYQFASAKRYFEQATKEAEKNKVKYVRIEKSLKELKRLEGKAKKLGAEKLAKILFEDAQSQARAAQEALQSGESLFRVEGAISRAKAAFNEVFREIERKKKEQERLAKLKKEAEQEKVLMLQKRKEAQQMGAEKKRATEFVYAEDTAREADKYYEEGNYELAIESYKAAKAQYAQIVESIVAEKKFAELSKQQAPPIAPGDVGKLSPPQEIPGQVQPQEGVGISPEQPMLTGYDALVAANLDKLVSGAANYENGKIFIDYSDGLVLQKDAKGKWAWLKFRHKEGGVAQDFSFWTGGSGFLFLVPKFKREVTVTFNFLGEVFEPSSIVVAQVLNNGRFGYGALFGVIACRVRGAYGIGSRMPTAFKGIRGGPNQWVDRKDAHQWQLKTVWPPDSKYGTLEVYYDGQLVSKLPRLRNEVGVVAFGWYRSKFRVQHLKVEGVLDPKWVIETLEKKGVTVSDDIKIEVGLMKPKKKPAGKKTKEKKASGTASSKAKPPNIPAGKEIDF